MCGFLIVIGENKKSPTGNTILPEILLFATIEKL